MDFNIIIYSESSAFPRPKNYHIVTWKLYGEKL